MDVIQTRRPEVEAFLVQEHNSRNNNLLISFDWDVKWIMGSSSLAMWRTQVATLIMNCRNGASGNSQRKEIFFEMTKKKLEEFINVLEDCSKTLNLKEEHHNNEDGSSNGVISLTPSNKDTN